jgi:hypothetical protein
MRDPSLRRTATSLRDRRSSTIRRNRSASSASLSSVLSAVADVAAETLARVHP